MMTLSTTTLYMFQRHTPKLATSLNKRFNEENNGSARVLQLLVHFIVNGLDPGVSVLFVFCDRPGKGTSEKNCCW